MAPEVHLAPGTSRLRQDGQGRHPSHRGGGESARHRGSSRSQLFYLQELRLGEMYFILQAWAARATRTGSATSCLI